MDQCILDESAEMTFVFQINHLVKIYVIYAMLYEKCSPQEKIYSFNKLLSIFSLG